MDKNFIKVDDLFRQRLRDGEERERSGAWLNMRELLDKEMPQQKRIGAFYWRRLFSAVAALSLIGTVCVSSYELSAAFRNRAVSESIPEVPVSVNGEPATTLTMPRGENETGREVRGVSRVGAARSGKERHTVSEYATTEGGKVSAPAAEVNTNEVSNKRNNNSNEIVNGSEARNINRSSENSGTAASDNSTAVTRPITVDGNVHHNNIKTKGQNVDARQKDAVRPVNRTVKHTDNAIASAESAGRSVSPSVQDVNKAHVAGKTVSEATAEDTKGVALNHDTQPTGTTSKAGSEHSKRNTTPATSDVSMKTPAREAVAAREESASHSEVGSRTNSNNRVAKGRHDKTAGKMATGNTSATLPTSDAGRVASNTSKKSHAGLPSETKKPADMALNSTANNNSNNKPSAGTHKASNSDELHKLASENINKLAAADIAAMGQTGGTKQKGETVDIPSADAHRHSDVGSESNGTSAAKPSSGSDAANSVATTGNAPATSIHDQPSSGKRVITKLVVHERTFKVADNEYALRSDTISKERIEMDMNEKPAPAVATKTAEPETPPAVSSKKTTKRLFARRNGGSNPTTPGMAGNTTASQRRSGTHAIASSTTGAPGATPGSTANTANATNEMAPSAAIPVSSASTSASTSEVVPAASAEEVKAKASESKHKGLSVVKKLAAAFNDVKTNASKTRFAPGLTAGVNSYFFGPATLKGFQFGLTGEIIFNDSWNIMTELKYFHRVNNNTSIQDNYYTYTPVGTQYLKQLQMNSYSFSALHSLEMPVAVRFHKGSFNFYAGGNLLYAFSINTGASAIPAYNVAPEYVNAPGADDKGVLSETDFASRFGLGYLFGFSYNLSQNFSLDLRNVQTVWDNASSTGAKSISSQLYKAPSVQLSVMYRLGGNRSKD